MPRYVAFLRGVSPMNAKMPELRLAFEAAGFTDVKTVLSSGNVVFNTRSTSQVAIERRAESAMARRLGGSFLTIVRPVDGLIELLAADPFAAFRLPPNAKRVITFLRDRPTSKLSLPLEVDSARILAVKGREIFTAYVPGPREAAFMRVIEKTFGTSVTSRTWDTVRKCTLA